MPREREILDLIKSTFPAAKDLILGNGDDAAILPPQLHCTGITCDSFVEDVHFKIHESSPQSIGYKAVTAAISDLPAMGYRPRYILLSAALPKNVELTWIKWLLAGIQQSCEKYGVHVIGGDTTGSSTGVVICVTALGAPWNAQTRMMTQSLAKEGDSVFVSGTLGDSLAGLLIKQKQYGLAIEQSSRSSLIQAHDEPQLNLKLSEWLSSRSDITSCTDVSDGLIQDLGKIGRNSVVGFKIDVNQLPISADLYKFARHSGLPAIDLALQSGEEYNLLFTVHGPETEIFRKEFEDKFRVKINPLGVATKGGFQLESKGKRYSCRFNYNFEH